MMHLPLPVLCCTHFLSRARGLLGREQLLQQAAVLILPCRGVHTFGMQGAIDLAYLDREHRVLELVAGLQPWQWRPARYAATRSCLEVAPDRLAAWGVRVGTRLAFRRLRYSS